MALQTTEFAPPDEDDAPKIRWSIVILTFTVLGVLRFSTFYLDDLTRSHFGTLATRLLEEMTGAYGSLLLFPLVVALERHFPLTRGRWRRHWSVHLGGFLVFSTAHTTFLAVSRDLLSPLFGLGEYDYGRMSVRYFMEASTDAIAFGMFVGALTHFRTQLRLRQRERRAAALERDAATARLESLSLQLQPHFLFNALNTISSTVYDDPTAADEMIGRLGDLLRHSLRTTGRQEITVDEELVTLRAYLAFVEARFGDRLHVALQVEPSALGLAVPAFILQPLVENAVRHGAATEYQDAGIRIALSRHAAELQLDVENDVHATPDEPLPMGTGLGTTRARLQLLYGDAGVLQTSSEAGRFRVTVRLPARTLPPAAHATPTEEHAGAHR